MSPRKRTILVKGCAHVGKGRTTFEAAQALPDYCLVIPASFEGLKTIRNLWPPCPGDTPVLLWLDHLQELIRPAGLSSVWLDGWLQDAPEMKIVDLLRMEDLEKIEQSGEINQPLRDALDWIQRNFADFTVSRCHSPSEQAEIEQLYPGEEVKGSLGIYLVTVDEHLKRFEASKEVCPEGFLVVLACAVAQGHVRHRQISESLLKAVYRAGAKQFPSTRRLTMSEFPSGLEYATAEFGDHIAPLVQPSPLGTTMAYETPSYIVEYVVEHLFPQEDLTEGQVGELWGAILGQVEASDALEMGRVAYNQGCLDRARAAWSKALTSGDLQVKAVAGIFLAVAAKEQANQTDLEDADRRGLLGQALDFLEQARQTTDLDCRPWTNRLLGDVLTDLGRYREAEVAYQRAIDSMHPDEGPRAMWRMGRLLHHHLNDPRNARVLFEQAMVSDHYDVTPRAGFDFAQLLLAPGRAVTPEDRRLAIYALERASRSEHPEIAPQAGFMLGEHHRQQGEYAQAIAAFERVAQFQDSSTAQRALLHLGEIRADLSEFEAAKASLQQLLDQWPPSALSPDELCRIGGALRRCGDLGGARTVFQRVMGSDDHGAAARAGLSLGALESEQGDPAAARRALVDTVPRAGQSGDKTLDASVKVELGNLCRRQGDLKSAVAMYKQAMKAVPHRDTRDLKNTALNEAIDLFESYKNPSMRSEGQELFERAYDGITNTLGQALDARDPSAAAELANHLVKWRSRAERDAALEGVLAKIEEWPDQHLADKARLDIAEALEKTNHLDDLSKAQGLYAKVESGTSEFVSQAAESHGRVLAKISAVREAKVTEQEARSQATPPRTMLSQDISPRRDAGPSLRA